MSARFGLRGGLDRGYEVEWCSRLVVNANGDAQYDISEYSFREFPDFVSAKLFAERVAPKADGIQAANIRQFVRDRWGQKDYVGESVEVSA